MSSFKKGVLLHGYVQREDNSRRNRENVKWRLELCFQQAKEYLREKLKDANKDPLSTDFRGNMVLHMPISESQLPQQWENSFLCCSKLPSIWYSVMAALGNQYKHSTNSYFNSLDINYMDCNYINTALSHYFITMDLYHPRLLW